MEENNNEKWLANALGFLTFHSFELEKQIKFVLEQKKLGLKMSSFMERKFRNTLPSLGSLNETFSKVLDMEHHERMALLMDDLNRLISNNPDMADEIMTALEIFVENPERIGESKWIEVTEETEITEGHFWAVDRLTNEVFDATVDFCFDYKDQVIKKFKNEVSYFQPIIKPIFNEKVK